SLLLLCPHKYVLFPYTTLFRSEMWLLYEVIKVRKKIFMCCSEFFKPKIVYSVLTGCFPVVRFVYVFEQCIICDYVFRHCVNFSRSEEHTSELQSRFDLVCRLLL